MRDPNSSTPKGIREIITRHSPKNRYGEPNWRLIRSFDHTMKKEGWWHEFGDGTIEQVVRGPNGQFLHNPLTAKSVTFGIRETPIWPVSDGWILERWMPPEVWDERENWPAARGPYPERGEYYIILGPWDEMPPLDFLCNCMDYWEREFEYMTPEKMVKAFKLMRQLELEEERRKGEELEKELRALYLGEIKPIFNSTSLEAQRVRNEVQASIGESSHLGAGQ